MKRIQWIGVMTVLLLGIAGLAVADINEEISFTSYVDEPLYADLAVWDHSGWIYYDVYVAPGSCSYANLWVDTYSAAYSVCFYGELSDDFYGCVDAEFNEGFNFITVDYSGRPLIDYPPDEACDAYYFDSPYPTSEVYIVEEAVYYGHGDGGCFIGSLVEAP